MWVVSVSRWLDTYIVGPTHEVLVWLEYKEYYLQRPATKYLLLDYLPEGVEFTTVLDAMNNLSNTELEKLYACNKTLRADEMLILLQSLSNPE